MCDVSGNVKGLSGLMSQYAQDSDSEDSDDDVDTSVYDVETGTSQPVHLTDI